MCYICLEWKKGKLTNKEALRNLGEFIDDPHNTEEDRTHLIGLSARIVDSEIPFSEWDNDSQTGGLEELDEGEA